MQKRVSAISSQVVEIKTGKSQKPATPFPGTGLELGSAAATGVQARPAATPSPFLPKTVRMAHFISFVQKKTKTNCLRFQISALYSLYTCSWAWSDGFAWKGWRLLLWRFTICWKVGQQTHPLSRQKPARGTEDRRANPGSLFGWAPCVSSPPSVMGADEHLFLSILFSPLGK